MTDERFEIDSADKADWAIREIDSLKADEKMWKEFYAEELRKKHEKVQASIDHLTSLLYQYFNQVPHSTTRTGIEKFRLPSGVLERKPPKYTYGIDTEKLVTFLQSDKTYSQYLKPQQPVPDWENLKKRTEVMMVTEHDDVTGEDVSRWVSVDKDTGEIIDGVNVTLTDATFAAKPDKKKENDDDE